MQDEEDDSPNDPFSDLVDEDNAFVKLEPNAIEEELLSVENIPSDTGAEMDIDEEILINDIKIESVSTVLRWETLALSKY